MSDSSIQDRRRAGRRTQQAAFAAVALVSLLLAAFWGGLSLPRGSACAGDGDAAVLRHEREAACARQLEQFSCIRRARVQLPSREWQPGAVIILEPFPSKALPDAAMLHDMLDVLSLLPDGPEKKHILVFDAEGQRLYPVTETAAMRRRQQEQELAQQVLMLLRPLLGRGQVEVLVSLEASGPEDAASGGRRMISLLLEEGTVPGSLRPQLAEVLRQARVLNEGRGDTLQVFWLSDRPGRQALVLRGAALGCLVLALMSGGMLLWGRRRREAVPGSAGAMPRQAPLPESVADSSGVEDMDSLRRQVADGVREYPGQGGALLRHWLAQDGEALKEERGGRGACN